MNEYEYRKAVLTEALESRTKEVVDYQINIDNYRLAIEEVDGQTDLKDFKKQLQELLAMSIVEQKKAKTMLNVIKKQLGEC